jgi:hypothetical protein
LTTLPASWTTCGRPNSLTTGRTPPRATSSRAWPRSRLAERRGRVGRRGLRRREGACAGGRGVPEMCVRRVRLSIPARRALAHGRRSPRVGRATSDLLRPGVGRPADRPAPRGGRTARVGREVFRRGSGPGRVGGCCSPLRGPTRRPPVPTGKGPCGRPGRLQAVTPPVSAVATADTEQECLLSRTDPAVKSPLPRVSV